MFSKSIMIIINTLKAHIYICLSVNKTKKSLTLSLCPTLPVWRWLAMPVHRDREKKESTVEEMEVEEHEQEASSSEEEDSDTSSVSEDGDSSGVIFFLRKPKH